MKTLFFLLGFLVGCCMLTNAQKIEELPVWPGGAPSGNGITAKETVDDAGRVSFVSEARIYVYHPAKEKNTGKAVIICPGGGYGILAMRHEGEMFARWLAERGITGIILKYRLPNHHPEIPLADASRAIRLVRSRAQGWGINPAKIGIAGFSAGGHLASTAGTHFTAGTPEAADLIERCSSRPDFMILFYPVISLTMPGVAHSGSRSSLLGNNSPQSLADYYSNEKQVTAQTPPTFLVHCDDDTGVSPLNSLAFYEALKKAGVPAVLYIFGEGGHGWGLNENFAYYREWTGLLETWLSNLK